ncbi:MAG: signal transduction histidine kinase, nitrogen specific, NtrB [Deltaproteobacteria bacterium]|nr:signal transduction histidine kinase, nitrogen specific, NtrB [Deltaproteobacteria bacterium]
MHASPDARAGGHGLPLYSLRAKLLLFSLLLVVVPGVVFALILIASARSALEDAVGRQLVKVAHDTASEVSDLLAREGSKITAWANHDVLREIRIGDAKPRITDFLISLNQSDTGYLDLLCVDADGRVVAASDRALIGGVRADNDWFHATRAGNEFLGGPQLNAADDQPTLEIAAPIRDPGNRTQVIGALLGVYDWKRGVALAERVRINSAALGLTVDVLILNADGMVIAASRNETTTIGGRNLRTAGWLSARSRDPGGSPGYVREPQADALVGFALLKGPQYGWTALAMQPVDEALAPVYRMERHLTLLLIGVLLVGLGVAVLLADRMGRPLRELTRATQEIARAGSPHAPVPVRSRDEIGQLAEAFNTMAGELKRAQDDLVTAGKFAFVGEIAAGVAHEVRTPLGILRTSAQILGRSLSDDPSQNGELVGMIISEVDRIDRVVAGFLEIARPRELLIEPTPLNTILRRALDFVDVQARQKGITLRQALDADQPPARCDPVQIYQVALNLIVNALQMLPAGGEITVSTLPLHHGRVSFEVSDNGAGIAPEMQERIFTPFFTMREGGTGLGLALVQRIVQAHQGAVTVESAIGHGTTFRVELPAVQET